MPVTGEDLTALQIGSTPLVVCMRSDDVASPKGKKLHFIEPTLPNHKSY